MNHQKIPLQHLQKTAYVYLRQSTMGQVRFHQESTERQYALREKAIQMGWKSESIHILDADLGLSGTSATHREDFKALVAEVSMNHKARKGELRYPLPVGYCCQDQKTIIDPDQEVQGVIRLLFEKFHETGSAYAVVRYFATHDITFPKRAYGGAWSGKLLWGRLGHGRVMGILHNPCYTGAYVYGRYHSQKHLADDGTIHLSTKVLPEKEWDVLIKDHHEAYITWAAYEKNIRTLTSNYTHNPLLQGGAAREGQAILQGLLLCSGCGRKLTVCYYGNNGHTLPINALGRREKACRGVCVFRFVAMHWKHLSSLECLR